MFGFNLREAVSTLLRWPGAGARWVSSWTVQPIEDRLLALAYGAILRAFESAGNAITSVWEDLTATAYSTVAEIAEVPLDRAHELGEGVAKAMRSIFRAAITSTWKQAAYLVNKSFEIAETLVLPVRFAVYWATERILSLEWWRDVFNGAIGALQGFANWAAAVLADLGARLASLAYEVWNIVYPFLWSQVQALWVRIDDVFNFLWAQVTTALNAARDALQYALNALAILARVVDFLKVLNIFDDIFEFLLSLVRDALLGVRDGLKSKLREEFPDME